jgi:hypothetical protein
MTHRRALVLKFEDRFFDDPATVERIATLFPAPLPSGEGRRIFEALRRESVEAFIARLESLPTTERSFDEATGQWDTYDEATGWHKHHAGRNAEIGRWQRELSEQQAATILRRMQPWMEKFGYHSVVSHPASYQLNIGRYAVVG